MRSERSAGVVLVAFVLTACGVGSGTMRIDQAEEAVVAAAEGVVAALGLDVDGPVVLSAREPCQLRTGEAGLRSRVVLRAAHDDPPAALMVAAGVLVDEGLVIVESGVPGTLLGQREGISVTLGSDGRGIQFDGLTGCRPR